MTERTSREEALAQATLAGDGGRVRAWERVLAAALRHEGAIQRHAPSAPEDHRALAVFLESTTAGTAELRLDKGCAAAIVAALLRQGGVLHPRSGPADVRRAVASRLAETAAELGDDSVRILQEPPGCVWDGTVVLDMDLGGDVVSATLRTSPQTSLRRPPPVHRGSGGIPELELELPFVVALGRAAPEDVEDWAPGDVWLPELGWLVTPDALHGTTRDVDVRTHVGATDGVDAADEVDATDEVDRARGAGKGLRRGALLLPGAQSGLWVRVEGDSLRFDGELLVTRELWGDPGPGRPRQTESVPDDGVEVRVTAGTLRLPLARWSSLAPGALLHSFFSQGELPSQTERSGQAGGHPGRPPWALYVASQLRAWGEPCRWEGSWGVRLLQIVEPPPPRGRG